MALNKKRSASASTSTETTSTETASKPSMDLAALQTALAQIVQLVADLSGKLEAANGRIDELENKLNAALEDDDDEDDDDDDEDEDEDEEVTEDDIDCNKAFEQYKSLEGDQQKKVLAKAMESSGIKSAKSKDIKTNAKLALAIADVMCDDEFGWDVDDFLKD